MTVGAPLAEIRDLLGHSTIMMTERYAHLAPENLRSCLETAVSSQAVSHQSDHRQMNPGFAGRHQAFVVLAEAA
ncbi:hypothetical protein [Thiocapsa sp.]|uniref:hypothetical protein n=1 Tax=Thiocapsa sp. TaxID=2024551 RepID=UPI003593FDA0